MKNRQGASLGTDLIGYESFRIITIASVHPTRSGDHFVDYLDIFLRRTGQGRKAGPGGSA